MSCKFHTFRTDLIRNIFFELKTIAENDSYSTFYEQKKSFGQLYSRAYNKYYPKAPEHAQLLEMLGLNLDALIVTFWNTFEDANMAWSEFEYTIGRFIETQFDTTLLDRHGFFCNCDGLKMESPPCHGDGTCLAICNHICTCDTEPLDPNIICTCDHGYFCPVKCPHNCPPRPCKNYMFCTNTVPQWLYNINNGLCSDSCRWRFGPLKRLISEAECPICNDKQENVVIACGHSLCFACWQRITRETNIQLQSPRCPFCRHPVQPEEKNIILGPT